MFENFRNARIIDVVAYGADDYDYTRYICGLGTDIGATGYMKIIFSCGSLFFSTDGIDVEPPLRSNAHRLAIDDAFRTSLIGQKLEYISKDEDAYIFQLYGCYPIICSMDMRAEFEDRDYFSISVLDPDD